MKRRPRRLATAPVVPVPQNGSSTRSSGRELDRMTRASSASGFCVGCSFLPSRPLSRSSPVHSGKRPVGAHLDVFVAGLQRFVIEGVALGAGVARRPDHRLVRVGEAAAAEIRHRVELAPDHVVEDPEAEILHDRADAEDVVVGADHPDGGGGLHHAPAGGEPGFGELVVGGKARELVPVVVDRIDVGIVGALEVVRELEIVGRVGENQIDAAGGSFAISSTQSPTRMRDDVDDSETTRGALAGAPRRDTTMTQNSDSGDAVGDAGPTTDRPALWVAKVKIGLAQSAVH